MVYTQKLGTFLNGKYSTVTVSQKVGTVDYDTGKFSVDFTDETFWTDNVYTVTNSGTTTTDGGSTVENYTFYDRTEFLGTVSYNYAIIPGTSNTFTLVKPDSGYLKEGANNFFVFADLDGNGEWNDGEPAGVPDQHNVDIGFDLVNKPLHVALTTKAPAGSVRLDVKSILGVLITEDNTNDAVTGDNSSITNPTTKQPLNPSLFNTGLDYYLVLTEFENVATGTPTTNPALWSTRRSTTPRSPISRKTRSSVTTPPVCLARMRATRRRPPTRSTSCLRRSIRATPRRGLTTTLLW